MYLGRQKAALPQLAVNLQALLQQRILLLAQGVNLPSDLLLVLSAALPQLPTLLRQLFLQVLQPAGHSHNVLIQGLGQQHQGLGKEQALSPKWEHKGPRLLTVC